jgi:Family of unknown function (DUF6011)
MVQGGRAVISYSHPTSELARQTAYWRARGRPAVAKRIEAELAAGDHCRRCTQTLTNPESIAAGMRPDCQPKVSP